MIGAHVPMVELRQRAAAWREFFTSYPATHFVTLAYNNVYGGTASLCHRLTSDGEFIPLPTSGVPVESGINRLPTIRRIRLEQVHADLDRLHRNVDRKLFGTNFNELPEERRTSFIGFVEHPESNVHVHTLWRVPEGYDDDFTEKVEARWKAVNRFHSTDVQPIRDDGAASYTCKDHVGRALEDDPALFVFSRACKRP